MLHCSYLDIRDTFPIIMVSCQFGAATRRSPKIDGT